ncbi:MULTISPECIES: hypothetical protein [Nocardia]|uniref:Uncharacterized protein n=1 Tax=Nocardia africana TaxID=134964 RepID=A0A378X7S3_9NOCA|nr:hypothetical protein [Nocardia africana]MCC3317946.1 hypothetical protein [Nocardia africana]SUA48721.1 Uncharacterised protein [Nocardia africana]
MSSDTPPTNDPNASDAAATAVDILARRASSAEEFFPDDLAGREAFTQRCKRASTLAALADRVLHAHWQRIDRSRATALSIGDAVSEEPRSVQEELVAEWAWAHAEFSNPDFAEEMDFQLMARVGIDSTSVLRSAPRDSAANTAAKGSVAESD